MQMFLSKVHGSARNILFLQLHKLYKKGLACPLQSSTIRLHITDVLHNSRRSIYTDESMIRFEVEYDSELVYTSFTFTKRTEDLCSLTKAMLTKTVG